jgi:SNF2 family DNA or RNA helicase
LCEKNIFRRAISQPIKDGDELGLQNLRLSMAFTALRRSKETLTLPDKTVELRSVTAPPASHHQKIYDTIYESARATLGAVLQQDTNGPSNDSQLLHTSIFEVLTRLRQACCCGTLVPKERLLAAEQVLAIVRKKDKLTAEEGHELLEKLKGVLENEDEIPECAICMEELVTAQAVVLRQCGHVFCNDCLKKTLEYKTACAFCRKPFQQEDLIPYDKAVSATAEVTTEPSSLLDDWETIGPSPKMDALLQALSEMQPDEKGTIVCFYTYP